LRTNASCATWSGPTWSEPPDSRSPARVLERNLIFVAVSYITGPQFIFKDARTKYIQVRKVKAAHNRVNLCIAELHHLVIFQKVAILRR